MKGVGVYGIGNWVAIKRDPLLMRAVSFMLDLCAHCTADSAVLGMLCS